MISHLVEMADEAMRITGRIMKKLRRAMDERLDDATAVAPGPDLSDQAGA